MIRPPPPDPHNPRVYLAQPFDTRRLAVGDGHRLHVAHYGRPRATLCWIEGVGHDPYAPPMLAAAREALRGFARHGRFALPR